MSQEALRALVELHLPKLQDFNSNDAFPLLEEYRCVAAVPDEGLAKGPAALCASGSKFLSYNDDIQGTASVAVAAVLGGIKCLGCAGSC